MVLLDLPRWLFRWITGLFLRKPAKFIAMRYYDAKNFVKKEQEEDEKKAKASGKTTVRVYPPSGTTRANIGKPRRDQ